MAKGDVGKEIAKAQAIAKNVDRKKRGSLALLVNGLAEGLATRDVSLSRDQEDDLLEILDRIKSGAPKPDDNTIHMIGSIGKDRKDGTYGWYKNLIVIFKAGLFIDFRNLRLFDFPERKILDFKRHQMRNMTDEDIEEFMKVATNRTGPETA